MYTDNFGYMNKTTNKFNGLVGDLIDGRADIGGTAIFMTTVRVPLIDYLTLTTDTAIKFIFRAPPLSNVANIYILPFDKTVWLCTGVLLMIFVLVIFGIIKILNHRTKIWPDSRNSRRSLDICSNSFLMGISAICQMDFEWPMKILSGKISTVS